MSICRQGDYKSALIMKAEFIFLLLFSFLQVSLMSWSRLIQQRNKKCKQLLEISINTVYSNTFDDHNLSII